MSMNVDVTVIPLETLQALSTKRAGDVLAMLERETMFDVPLVALLLNLGQQAIHAELERRHSLVPEPVEQPEVDAALATMFGGVLDVSMEGSSEQSDTEAFEQRLDNMAITTKGDDIQVVEAAQKPMLFTVVDDDGDDEAAAVEEKLERLVDGMPGMKFDDGSPF